MAADVRYRGAGVAVNQTSLRFAWLGILLLAGGCSQKTSPLAAPADSATADAPGRVARLSYVEGTVSFKAAGTAEWVLATLNRPLTTGDELWTAAGSRAELELGHADVRMDAQSSLEFLNLNDHFVQVRVVEGAVETHIERLDEDDEFEIDTPQAALTLLRTGNYRVNVAADGNRTVAIARTGQIDAASGTQSFTIRATEQAQILSAGATYEITAAPPLDAFDTFVDARERRVPTGQAQQNVSPYVVGRGDLDVYGTWQTYSAYGPVWMPRGMPPGWAPYRFGHWVWIAPWGWTWVDDAPWGFAPFHYGRWVMINGVWVWVPGPPRIRAIYAPALVIFVGGGGPGLRWHFGVGMGLGVAWFPLGPREIYIPPYRASRVYITNVNISHTVIANPGAVWRTDAARQHYVNRVAPGGITAVPEDVFSGARPVGGAAVRVNPADAGRTRIDGTAAPVPPSRRSTAPGPDGGRIAPQPPAGVEQRPVTVRGTPSPRAVPFEQQRPALDRNPGRPVDPSQVEELRRQQPAPAQRPEYRQARPAQQPRSAPPPRAPERQAPPTQIRPPQQPRQDENRRRTIEQEHQRDSQRSSGSQQGGSTRGRGK